MLIVSSVHKRFHRILIDAGFGDFAGPRVLTVQGSCCLPVAFRDADSRRVEIRGLPEIGQRIRIAVKHDGLWRPLLWIRAGKDGSIYVGLLMGKPTVARAGEKKAEKVTEVKYSEFEDLDEFPKSSRLSFHPSGEVHIGDNVVTGLVPLAELKRPLQLCTILFAHPGRYRPPDRKGPEDYDLGIEGYQLDEERPMYGAIVVAPWSARAQLPQN